MCAPWIHHCIEQTRQGRGHFLRKDDSCDSTLAIYENYWCMSTWSRVCRNMGASWTWGSCRVWAAARQLTAQLMCPAWAAAGAPASAHPSQHSTSLPAGNYSISELIQTKYRISGSFKFQSCKTMIAECQRTNFDKQNSKRKLMDCVRG